MGLFRPRMDPRDSLIAALRAELSDLRDLVRQERATHESDRRQLLDTILAMAHPAALREMRRTSPGDPGGPARFQATSLLRMRYPGGDARVLPPPPQSPPDSPLESFPEDSTPGKEAS